jgi:FKBP-type peptidyl-prolyl cis-trans isomerase FkpA
MSGDFKTIYYPMWIKKMAFLLLLMSVVSCGQKHSDRSTITRRSKNDMADLNRYLIQKDRERIKNYIERKNLKMSESPTGLWFQIIRQGSGNSFSESDKVIMDYECSLLDGTKCYSSKELGPKEVTLGRSDMGPGLNEGLRLLKPGAEAIFIIPPFLAYGLVGDRKMIPPRAVIVYNVNILQPK